LVQITSDIELSGAGCTTAITPNQLVQSSSENDSEGKSQNLGLLQHGNSARPALCYYVVIP
jgi:hypothetical protein